MFKTTLFLLMLSSTVLSFRIIPTQKNIKPNYCYATDKNPYTYLATKTGYEFVHGDDLKNDLPECKPVLFWSLNRHGTRLPGKKSIKRLQKLTEIQEEILNNYENEVPSSINNGLCEQDIELFENWFWNDTISKKNATFLTSQGWDDLRNIARRNLKKFPELLGIDYSEKDYLFRYTRTERTESSFKAYSEGLFGTYENIHAISVENDTLIQSYKYCKVWDETVDENPETYIEYNKFKQSDIFQGLLSSVSDRLGFKCTLNSDLINDIYDMCRFQQAWYLHKQSAWCAAFTKEHLQLLEYAEDLMYYYSTGHGTEMNKKVGCMPLKDMITRFENVINGVSTEPKSVHYFSHSSAIQLLMAAMEMNKDKIPLTAENWNQQKDRLWKTSFIGPFATNINAVLFKCTETAENQVIFYLNERKYEFPGCPNGVCSWETVKEKFLKTAENCNLDFCKNDEK